MDICILAAGAAGMYCGSCLRDSALASALLRLGHRVTLVPLYTPLRTDTPTPPQADVFFGGINSYLQYASPLFRHTPRALDWLLDRPWLLNLAGQFSAQSSPASLGPFILSILQGEAGPQAKEVQRLADFLRDLRPDVVSLPNLMFIAAARPIRDTLKLPVVCELTGEDIFLDAMAEPFRSEAAYLIRAAAVHVSRFVATSAYYADRMSHYLQISRSRIDVVHPGIPRENLADSPAPRTDPPTIGYFARICPEKGLHRLIEAVSLLRRDPRFGDVRLRAAGYLGAAHRDWFEQLQDDTAAGDLADAFTYVGEVDLPGKLAFLDSADILSVPTVYPEPKGIYVLEALARHVPVVLPAHGAFPELIHLTGGGVLSSPDDPAALAAALADLLADPARRHALAAAGHRAVRERFTDEHMAARMLQLYQDTLS